MSMVELVKGCSLFHEIYDDEIEDIIKHCLVASYDKADLIIKEGDSSTDICILLSGSAEITVSREGKEQFIATLNPGDIFGELVLINETKRTANIRALGICDVLILSYENFYSFYHKKPKVFSIMVLNVTRLITKRLKATNEIIEDLGVKLSRKNDAA